MSTPGNLETAELDIGETSHLKLDEPIFEWLDDNGLDKILPDQLDLRQLARILTIIVLVSNPRLHSKFNKPELLAGQPQLQEAIRGAFRQQSFENVRNIKMLWSSKAKALESQP
ncbi:hypothetical protein BJ138DRAFT_1181698 [Hygrophoropsis aurantiaca]|uniref:Uncharacterized protein n=1 Tax=Hygrophoropsis aurantiaca TaxID=72124 RepID=A0ACB8A618_9AGAM|nr:hypothetical protein BJ138DRAFT_1181698 [Hygrophoropsis aurantiaca]